MLKKLFLKQINFAESKEKEFIFNPIFLFFVYYLKCYKLKAKLNVDI